MDEFSTTIKGGDTLRIKTAGKYCDRDILVHAEEGGGGFTPPTSEFLDPDEVYRTTRPVGWLPMPVPNDYECYCLGHILKGLPGYFAANITYTESCTVEYGTVVDGVFVAKESFTPTSGTLFYKELAYDDYGDELSDGTRQYMVRIYGTAISEINFRKLFLSIPPVDVVDIVSGIACTVTAGDHNNHRSGLKSLVYVRFVGNGRPRMLSDVFVGGCRNLLSVSMANEIPSVNGHGGDGQYAFYECGRLIAVSQKGFSEITDASFMFYGTSAARIKTSAKPTNMNSTFYSSKIKFFGKSTFDTTNVADMTSCFRSCYNLSEVTGLNISSLTKPGAMFGLCYNLSRLVFEGETTPGGWTISLRDTSLGHAALVEMIGSLPRATNTATIIIANNSGAEELTADEIAVATRKNWTITT